MRSELDVTLDREKRDALEPISLLEEELDNINFHLELQSLMIDMLDQWFAKKYQLPSSSVSSVSSSPSDNPARNFRKHRNTLLFARALCDYNGGHGSRSIDRIDSTHNGNSDKIRPKDGTIASGSDKSNRRKKKTGKKSRASGREKKDVNATREAEGDGTLEISDSSDVMTDSDGYSDSDSDSSSDVDGGGGGDACSLFHDKLLSFKRGDILAVLPPAVGSRSSCTGNHNGTRTDSGRESSHDSKSHTGGSGGDEGGEQKTSNTSAALSCMFNGLFGQVSADLLDVLPVDYTQGIRDRKEDFVQNRRSLMNARNEYFHQGTFIQLDTPQRKAALLQEYAGDLDGRLRRDVYQHFSLPLTATEYHVHKQAILMSRDNRCVQTQ